MPLLHQAAKKETNNAPFTDMFLDTLYNYQDFIGQGAVNPIAEPLSTPTTKSVVIVGAGAAGMCAAWELLRVGIKPIIIESSDRIGGRAWSKQWDVPVQPGKMKPYAEMGSMRVPPVMDVFGTYSTRFGAKHTAIGFPDPGKVPTTLYYENVKYDWAPKANPPGPFNQINTDFNNFMGPIITEIQNAWPGQPNGSNAALQKVWQGMIDKYWNKSFFQAVSEGIPQWTAEQLSQFGALGVGSGGFGPLYAVNFVEMIRIIATGWETNQKLWYDPELSMGMQAMPVGFYTNSFPDGPYAGETLQSLNCLQLNTRVTGIHRIPGTRQMQVQWSPQPGHYDWPANGGIPPVNIIVADAVIVATTTRSMEVMGLTVPPAPELDTLQQGTKNGIRKLHLMNSSKMFICTEKFWTKSSYKGPENIQTDEMPRGVYTLNYPDCDYGVVLISYSWGDDSTKIISIPTEERYQLFEGIIRTISPEFADGLLTRIPGTEIYNVDWEDTPDYYGAFKLPYPGQDVWCQAAYFNFLRTDLPVYLAGDSNSWSGGWTEGALHTGLNSACAVAREFGAAVRPNSPLTQDPTMYNYSPPHN